MLVLFSRQMDLSGTTKSILWPSNLPQSKKHAHVLVVIGHKAFVHGAAAACSNGGWSMATAPLAGSGSSTSVYNIFTSIHAKRDT